MKLACGHYGWVGGHVAPTIPHLPDVEPPRAPAQPGEQGEQFLVAIGRFPTGGVRGVLWNARIDSLAIRDRRLGPNQVTISAPTDPVTMRLVGDLLEEGQTQAGGDLYHVKDAIQFELLVGSTLDGLTRWRFVVRDQVTIADGRISMTGVGWVGGLTSDRVIGPPTRKNLLGDAKGSFEGGSFLVDGWTLVGDDIDGGVEPGGIDGGFKAWLTGVPDGSNYLEAEVTYSQPVRPWGRQRIAGSAYVFLPSGVEIDDFGLVSMAIFGDGEQVWPGRNGDPEAGVVTSDMPRGSWHKEPVTAIGYLPTPPYSATVKIRLYPVHESQPVYFDGSAIFRRENTSTVNSIDLTRHVEQLLRHAQSETSGKSPWGITTVEGDPLGISEVGTWWWEDGQSLNEALEALAGRGMDIFDLAGPGRKVMATRRRGSVRTDISIRPWDILGSAKWTVDPGAQRTAIRGVSAAGSIWGGADEGAVDTSQSGGQVLDVILSGPVGMTPTQLRAWLLDQLASVSLLPATTVLILPWHLGVRLGVGDTIQVPLRSGSAGHLDWMRVTEWVPEHSRRFVAVAMGTDPELGGQ